MNSEVEKKIVEACGGKIIHQGIADERSKFIVKLNDGRFEVVTYGKWWGLETHGKFYMESTAMTLIDLI